MTRILALIFALAFATSGPALAQHQHAGHDHGHAHDHGAAVEAPDNTAIQAALAAGGSLVSVEILGVVCDFCATALNRTFSRREEVRASYVDLDTKTLSLVFAPGRTLDDETIADLVLRAGYRVDSIARSE